MKKKNILLIVLILCIGLFSSVVYLFTIFSPMASPIRYPENTDILSVMIGCNTSNVTIPMNEESYDTLFAYIKESKPTRKQSVNDFPYIRPYYCLIVETEEMQYYYFVYQEGEETYIEMPYQGIYKAESQLYRMILNYFK